jgi:hypothetical protein
MPTSDDDSCGLKFLYEDRDRWKKGELNNETDSEEKRSRYMRRRTVRNISGTLGCKISIENLRKRWLGVPAKMLNK